MVLVSYDDALIAPLREHLAGLGFELADLRRVGTPVRPILKIRIDRPDSSPGHGVTTEDCRIASRSLERYLEEHGIVGARYELEVSSPGLERPLVWADAWRRFAGQRAKVKSPELASRMTVEILGVPDDDHVSVRLPDGSERTIALAGIKEATLAVDWGAIGKKRT
jgi:ribosome maturation factor RimP